MQMIGSRRATVPARRRRLVRMNLFQWRDRDIGALRKLFTPCDNGLIIGTKRHEKTKIQIKRSILAQL